MKNELTCDVLLVEDDVAQCQEAASFLVRSRMDVVMAHSGASALRQAEICPPRAALIDYNLPDMNGVELARRLRAMFPNLAIVMISGRIDGLPQETLSAIGISAFANKPVPLLALRRGLLKLVGAAAPLAETSVEPKIKFGAGFGKMS